jgi:hypothetical protein
MDKQTSIEPISFTLLPELLNTVFPTTVQAYQTVSDLIQSSRRVRHQEGVWLVRPDQFATSDNCGWLVLSWPALT